MVGGSENGMCLQQNVGEKEGRGGGFLAWGSRNQENMNC